MQEKVIGFRRLNKYFGMSANLKLSSLLAVLALLCTALIGSLTYSVWKVNTLESKVEALHKLYIVDRSKLQLQNNEDTKIINSLKRFSRQVSGSGESSSDTLTTIVQKFIRNELYSIMECNRDKDNTTNCSLKPGPKGDKGSNGQQGESGPKGDKGVVGARGDRR